MSESSELNIYERVLPLFYNDERYMSIRNVMYNHIYLQLIRKIIGKTGAGTIASDIFRLRSSVFNYQNLCTKEENQEDIFWESSEDIALTKDALDIDGYQTVQFLAEKYGALAGDVIIADASYEYGGADKAVKLCAEFVDSFGFETPLKEKYMDELCETDITFREIYDSLCEEGFCEYLEPELVMQIMIEIGRLGDCSITKAYRGNCDVSVLALPLEVKKKQDAERFCEELKDAGLTSLFIYQDAHEVFVLEGEDMCVWCMLSTYGASDHEEVDYRHLSIDVVKAFMTFCDKVKKE